MPELQTFVFAQGASVDPITGQLSLHGLLDVVVPFAKASAPVAAGGGDPEGVLVALPATIVTTWIKSDGDQAAEWEQRVLVVAPDARVTEWQPPSPVGLATQVATVLHRLTVMSFRMPGRYELRLHLRNKNEDKWGDPVATRRFFVQDPGPAPTMPSPPAGSERPDALPLHDGGCHQLAP